MKFSNFLIAWLINLLISSLFIGCVLQFNEFGNPIEAIAEILGYAIFVLIYSFSYSLLPMISLGILHEIVTPKLRTFSSYQLLLNTLAIVPGSLFILYYIYSGDKTSDILMMSVYPMVSLLQYNIWLAKYEDILKENLQHFREGKTSELVEPICK